MLLILFIVCTIYLLLYSSFGEKRPLNTEIVAEQKEPEPYEYKIDYERNLLTLSGKGSWTFELEDKYMYDPDYKIIVETNECFGKPEGTKLRASGKKLYEYIHENDFKILDENYFISKKLNFYFDCANNKIRDIYSCPPGKFFHDGECQPINVCTGQKDGNVFPDFNDRHYYQICENEKPIRKRCKPDTFFMVDSCRSETQLNDLCKNNITVFPINNKKFIRCFNNEPMVEHCPKNMIILPSWDKCYPDNCLNYPDGYLRPMSNVTFDGLFTYSPGYFVCRDNKISETVYCPSQWDYYKKKTNLPSQLPMVFDSEAKKCVIPSFCNNVKGIDDGVVVPAHEFTKHVKNWKYSDLFDSVVGFKCDQQKLNRFILEPGKRIKDYRIVSGCDDDLQKIPIGNEINMFFDCREQKIVHCQPNEIFHVDKGCIKAIQNAHSFKNIPMFRLGNLSKYNNWLIPWNNVVVDKQFCNDTNLKYVRNYDVCVHPECEKFPFLKQLKSLRILIPNEQKSAACVYNSNRNTILKRNWPEEQDKKVNFWTQRLVPFTEDDEKCVPGQKVQSGNFLIDSTIYATCNKVQPFVFCPSSSTKGIQQLKDSKNLFACVPKNEVYEAIIPANTKVKFYTQEISHILPNIGAWYKIDEEPETIFLDKIITIDLNRKNYSFTYESNQDSKFFYRNLVNYPINVYIKNKELKTIGRSRRSAYWLKKSTFSDHPVKLFEHNIEEKIF